MVRKISVVTGSRAEYGLLKPLLTRIQNSRVLDLKLIVTGMHLSKKFGYTTSEIKKDGFSIAEKINTIPRSDTPYDMAISLGEGVVSFANVFKKLKPDLNVILGDRDEVLAAALAAYHMNIPNAHLHGGDRSSAGFDEYNRHAITKISNIHFAATKKSKKRIIKMGENPKFVFYTGSPGIDTIFQKKITDKETLEKKYRIRFEGNEVLLVYHPVTTQFGQSEHQINTILKALKKNNHFTIIIAPNSDAGNNPIFKTIKKFEKKNSFIFLTNVNREDYLGFLQSVGLLMGNSSSGIIEAGYFKIPVIDIGIRQLGREHNKNVITVKKINENSIKQAISKATKMNKTGKLEKTKLYGSGNSSFQITKILETIPINDELLQKQIRY